LLLTLLTALALLWLGAVSVVVGLCRSAAYADRGEAEIRPVPGGASGTTAALHLIA
jgi:hypothetical protein